MVENVGDENAQEEADVEVLGVWLVDSHLNDKTGDTAVKHDEVPVESHEEEVAEGVPLVFEKDWFALFQLLCWWLVAETVNVELSSFFDVLFRVISHHLDASHEELVHDLSICSRFIDVETARDSTLDLRVLTGRSGKSLILRSHIIQRSFDLLKILQSVCLEEISRKIDLVGLELGIFRT